MLRVIVFSALCTLVLLFIPTKGFEPDDELKYRMKSIKNDSDICQFMGLPDNCIDLLEESEHTDADGKMVVSGRGQSKIASFDACNPREMTVALPRSPDPDVTIWPTCTRTMRCGGCCTSDVFSCEPTATREKFIKIFDTQLPYPGAQRFRFLGVREVKIIEHTQCDAQCKTKSHECHSYQRYNARKCRCVCRRERMKLKSSCNDNQIWDDSECDCICPNRNTEKCPDPAYFSTTTCKCTLKMGVSGEIDLDKFMEHIEKTRLGSEIILNNDNELVPSFLDQELYMLMNGRHGYRKGDGKDSSDDSDADDRTTQTSTTTTTTEEPTTTTTTEATTSKKTTTTTIPTTPKPKPKQRPCMKTKCWGVWKPRLLKTGKCQCQPPFMG